MTEKELTQVSETVAMLSNHSYWTNELWRERLPEHKADRRGDVENAFLINQLAGIKVYAAPVGLSWAKKCDKESTESYLEKYKDIVMDYWTWWME